MDEGRIRENEEDRKRKDRPEEERPEDRGRPPPPFAGPAFASEAFRRNAISLKVKPYWPRVSISADHPFVAAIDAWTEAHRDVSGDMQSTVAWLTHPGNPLFVVEGDDGRDYVITDKGSLRSFVDGERGNAEAARIARLVMEDLGDALGGIPVEYLTRWVFCSPTVSAEVPMSTEEARAVAEAAEAATGDDDLAGSPLQPPRFSVERYAEERDRRSAEAYLSASFVGAPKRSKRGEEKNATKKKKNEGTSHCSDDDDDDDDDDVFDGGEDEVRARVERLMRRAMRSGLVADYLRQRAGYYNCCRRSAAGDRTALSDEKVRELCRADAVELSGVEDMAWCSLFVRRVLEPTARYVKSAGTLNVDAEYAYGSGSFFDAAQLREEAFSIHRGVRLSEWKQSRPRRSAFVVRGAVRPSHMRFCGDLAIGQAEKDQRLKMTAENSRRAAERMRRVGRGAYDGGSSSSVAGTGGAGRFCGKGYGGYGGVGGGGGCSGGGGGGAAKPEEPYADWSGRLYSDGGGGDRKGGGGGGDAGREVGGAGGDTSRDRQVARFVLTVDPTRRHDLSCSLVQDLSTIKSTLLMAASVVAIRVKARLFPHSVHHDPKKDDEHTLLSVLMDVAETLYPHPSWWSEGTVCKGRAFKARTYGVLSSAWNFKSPFFQNPQELVQLLKLDTDGDDGAKLEALKDAFRDTGRHYLLIPVVPVKSAILPSEKALLNETTKVTMMAEKEVKKYFDLGGGGRGEGFRESPTASVSATVKMGLFQSGNKYCRLNLILSAPSKTNLVNPLLLYDYGDARADETATPVSDSNPDMIAAYTESILGTHLEALQRSAAPAFVVPSRPQSRKEKSRGDDDDDDDELVTAAALADVEAEIASCIAQFQVPEEAAGLVREKIFGVLGLTPPSVPTHPPAQWADSAHFLPSSSVPPLPPSGSSNLTLISRAEYRQPAPAMDDDDDDDDDYEQNVDDDDEQNVDDDDEDRAGQREQMRKQQPQQRTNTAASLSRPSPSDYAVVVLGGDNSDSHKFDRISGKKRRVAQQRATESRPVLPKRERRGEQDDEREREETMRGERRSDYRRDSDKDDDDDPRILEEGTKRRPDKRMRKK